MEKTGVGEGGGDGGGRQGGSSGVLQTFIVLGNYFPVARDVNLYSNYVICN